MKRFIVTSLVVLAGTFGLVMAKGGNTNTPATPNQGAQVQTRSQTSQNPNTLGIQTQKRDRLQDQTCLLDPDQFQLPNQQRDQTCNPQQKQSGDQDQLRLRDPSLHQ